MANRQYIGARYVPKFYEGSNGDNWDNGVSYEPLTIVQYLNDSYTSKKPVPNTIGNPAQNPEYWAHTGAYNAQVQQYRNEVQQFYNLSKTCFVPLEDFGAVGDGLTDDSNALNLAVKSGKIIVGNPNKTYRINNTIVVTNSFGLQHVNLYMPSNPTLKECFLIDDDDLLITMDDVTFTSDMNQTAQSFEDTHLSSNILFYHCNEHDSALFISNSTIKNCEYCLKAEIGSIYASNCKLLNSMLPVFLNTTRLNLVDSKIECVASNSFYHCVYLHPYEIGEDGHIDNCEFISDVATSLQCYNSETLDSTLENFFISNSTFKDKNGNLKSAFSYNQCKIHFSKCYVNVRYKGYYDECVVEIGAPLQDVNISGCQASIESIGLGSDASLLVKNSIVIFKESAAQNINVVSGKLEFINNYIKILNTNNAIRTEGATIDMIDNIIIRDVAITAALCNNQGGVFNFVDNKYNCNATDINPLANIDLLNPSKNFDGVEYTSASDVATYETGFYDLHCKVFPKQCIMSFNTRLKVWARNDVICTLKPFIAPAFVQYAIAMSPKNTGIAVLEIDPNGEISIVQIEGSLEQTTLYTGFTIALA